MDNIAIQIEQIEEQIAYSYRELRDYYISLGNHICLNQSEMQIPLAVKYRENVENEREQFLLLQHKKEQREIVLEELALGKESVQLLKAERTKKEKDFLLLKRRLGALSIEQAGANVLSEEVTALLKDELDTLALLQTLLSSKSFFKKQQGKSLSRRLNRKQDARYEAIADKLYEKNYLIKLKGERAQSLVSEFVTLKLDIQTIDEEVSKFKNKLTSSKSSIERETNEIEKELDKTKSSWDEMAYQYGNYLFDNAAKWIGENTSDKVLDLLAKILEDHNAIEDLRNDIEKKKKQIEIDDLRALIERDKSAIATLEKERTRLFDQIKEIEQDILSLNHKIRKLELK